MLVFCPVYQCLVFTSYNAVAGKGFKSIRSDQILFIYSWVHWCKLVKWLAQDQKLLKRLRLRSRAYDSFLGGWTDDIPGFKQVLLFQRSYSFLCHCQFSQVHILCLSIAVSELKNTIPFSLHSAYHSVGNVVLYFTCNPRSTQKKRCAVINWYCFFLQILKPRKVLCEFFKSATQLTSICQCQSQTVNSR